MRNLTVFMREIIAKEFVRLCIILYTERFSLITVYILDDNTLSRSIPHYSTHATEVVTAN